MMDSTMFDPPAPPEPKTVKRLVAQVNAMMRSEDGKSRVLQALATLLLD